MWGKYEFVTEKSRQKNSVCFFNSRYIGLNNQKYFYLDNILK